MARQHSNGEISRLTVRLSLIFERQRRSADQRGVSKVQAVFLNVSLVLCFVPLESYLRIVNTNLDSVKGQQVCT
jgi:hypothetical protein